MPEGRFLSGAYGADLAARDVALRPTQESQAVLHKVLAAAAAAGKPVSQF